MDANLLKPEEENIQEKMQCVSCIMELALSCTIVTPDARANIEDALSVLYKIRHQFVNSCTRT